MARDLVQSQSSTPASSTAKTVRNTIQFLNEGEGESEQTSTLNTSTTSAATEDMDTNEQQSNDDGSGQVTTDVAVKKGSVGKSELIEQFFTRLGTGGFLCKLCKGSSLEQNVSIFGLAKDFLRIRFVSVESPISFRMSFARMRRQTYIV